MALPTALLVKGGVAASTVALGGVAIFQRENIYYLIYPNDNRELNDKIKALGISGCELGNGETKKENCTLSNKQLKNVKFSKDATDLTATGENISTELTIEKLGDSFKTDFPEGLRFTFKNTQDADLDIGTDSSNKITLKKNIDYDFKIKTADDKSLKLEKAWTLETLSSKVGLSYTSGESADCCTTGTSINIWKDGSNYKIGATGETGKKITVAKDSEGYPEGFKFTVGESSDITINGGTDKGTAITQLTKDNMSYEIALKEVGDDKGKKWFLVEKSTTPT